MKKQASVPSPLGECATLGRTNRNATDGSAPFLPDFVRSMRVLLIEDHPLFRQGLALVLAQLDEHLQPIYAHDASAALSLIEEQHDWDLVLLDLTLPDSDGF